MALRLGGEDGKKRKEPSQVSLEINQSYWCPTAAPEDDWVNSMVPAGKTQQRQKARPGNSDEGQQLLSSARVRRGGEEVRR